MKPYDENKIKEIINVFSNNTIEIKNDEYTLINLGNITSYKIYKKDIIFIEYYLRKCKIHTKRKVIEVRGKSLSNLVDEINCEKIVKSHKSYAINIENIESIEKEY